MRDRSNINLAVSGHWLRRKLNSVTRGAPGGPAGVQLWKRIAASVIKPFAETDTVDLPGDLIVRALLRLANNGDVIDPPTSGANLEIQWVDYIFGGTGTLNDVNLGDGFLKHATGFAGGAGAVSITGIASSSGGEQAYLFVNDCGQPVTFKNDDSGSSAENRIRTPGQVDLVVPPGAPGSFAVLLFRMKFPSGPTATRWVACPLNFAGGILLETANGAAWKRGVSEELVTIAAAASSDSAADLLPAGSIIEAVVVRVTVAIPTATTFDVGISGTPTRFDSAVPVAVNTTSVGLNHQEGSVATNPTGPVQRSAAKVRITPNATPANANGRVRVTVFYRTFVAPTS